MELTDVSVKAVGTASSPTISDLGSKAVQSARIFSLTLPSEAAFPEPDAEIPAPVLPSDGMPLEPSKEVSTEPPKPLQEPDPRVAAPSLAVDQDQSSRVEPVEVFPTPRQSSGEMPPPLSKAGLLADTAGLKLPSINDDIAVPSNPPASNIEQDQSFASGPQSELKSAPVPKTIESNSTLPPIAPEAKDETGLKPSAMEPAGDGRPRMREGAPIAEARRPNLGSVPQADGGPKLPALERAAPPWDPPATPSANEARPAAPARTTSISSAPPDVTARLPNRDEVGGQRVVQSKAQDVIAIGVSRVEPRAVGSQPAPPTASSTLPIERLSSGVPTAAGKGFPPAAVPEMPDSSIPRMEAAPTSVDAKARSPEETGPRPQPADAAPRPLSPDRMPASDGSGSRQIAPEPTQKSAIRNAGDENAANTPVASGIVNKAEVPRPASSTRVIWELGGPVSLGGSDTGPDLATPVRGEVDAVLSRLDPARFDPSRVAPESVARTIDVARSVQAQLIDTARQAPDGTIEVKLSPEELGRVRMTITQVEAGVSVAVMVERSETLDLMRRHADILSSELREAGFERLSFSFGQGSKGRPDGEAPPTAEDRDPHSISSAEDDKPEPRLPGSTHMRATQLDIRL